MLHVLLAQDIPFSWRVVSHIKPTLFGTTSCLGGVLSAHPSQLREIQAESEMTSDE